MGMRIAAMEVPQEDSIQSTSDGREGDGNSSKVALRSRGDPHSSTRQWSIQFQRKTSLKEVPNVTIGNHVARICQA